MDFFLYAIEKILISTAGALHRLRILLRAQKKIAEKSLKLDLGSGGTKKKGFIGIDAILGPGVDIEHNLEDGIPFADNSVSEIYSSHFLEHIPHRNVKFVLQECSRVLLPGGNITIEVPNLKESLQKFLKMDERTRWENGWEQIFGNQKRQFEYHKTGFTKGRLKELLAKTGFERITLSLSKHGPVSSLRAKAQKINEV